MKSPTPAFGAFLVVVCCEDESHVERGVMATALQGYYDLKSELVCRARNCVQLKAFFFRNHSPLEAESSMVRTRSQVRGQGWGFVCVHAILGMAGGD